MKYSNKNKIPKEKKNRHYHLETSVCPIVKPTSNQQPEPLFDFSLLAHKIYVEKVYEKDYDYVFTLQYNDHLVLELERNTNPVNIVDFVSSKCRFIANWDKLGIFKDGADDVLLDFLYKDEDGNTRRFVSKIQIVNAELDKQDCHKIVFNVKQGCGDDLEDIVKGNDEPVKIKNVNMLISQDRTQRE